MGKYNMAYSGEKIENCARMLNKFAGTYEKLSAKNDCKNPVADSVVLQLKETSRMLLEYTGTYSKKVIPDDRLWEDARNNLAKRGVRVGEISIIERGNGRHEVHVQLQSVKKKCPTTREVAGILSDALGIFLDSNENNRIMLNGNMNMYSFVESGRFGLMHGIARCNKEWSIVSGDVIAIENISDNKVLIAIADGMGSGIEANEDSSCVIELIEDALRAGFSERAVIQMINTAFSLNDILGVPITVDMCVVDRLLGIAEFIKLGAVATYVKRNNWVEIIQSETLPIGVLNKVDFDSSTKKMYANDYIIMISDGILESLPSLDKEKTFLDIILSVESKNPQKMAEEILGKVMNISKADSDIPKDDMTIIVTGLFART